MAEENNGTGSTAAATAQPKPAETFQKLLEKNDNDAIKLASQLFDENYTHRNTIRELTGKQPVDGAVVLSPEDAKKWRAFNEMGVEIDTVKQAIERVPELEKSNKELSQMEMYREVAAIGGYKVPVLKKLMSEHPEATFEIKTVKDKDGKDAKEVSIKAGDKEQPFAEFAEANFKDFLPALRAEQSAPETPVQNGNTFDPTPKGPVTDEAANNAAKAAQARATRSHF